jgi:hypothetical protein
MKKILLIALAAVAFSCGDKNNRASEGADDSDNTDNTELAEPDTTGGGLDSDTTSSEYRNNDAVRKDSIQ